MVTWTNVDLLLTGPSGTNYREISSKTHIFSFGNIHSKSHMQNVSHFHQAAMYSMNSQTLLKVTYGTWALSNSVDKNSKAETKWTPLQGWHFQMHFFNKNAWFLLKISLKFVPKVRINNIPALVQIMAWWRPVDKPLYEPMMVSLLMHICVTRPQWV